MRLGILRNKSGATNRGQNVQMCANKFVVYAKSPEVSGSKSPEAIKVLYANITLTLPSSLVEGN